MSAAVAANRELQGADAWAALLAQLDDPAAYIDAKCPFIAKVLATLDADRSGQ